ncbi:S-layer homology domain-containing protein [Propioniciclava soli]|uniref:S-layer homology domain-containing protein n=1 Tax=Propioniciclava soli TaxID=2775081 RepID=A0ABZ3C4V6_9ACTN
MHPLRRLGAALASAALLAVVAAPAPARAVTGPYLDILAGEAGDTSFVDVGNAGDAPLTDCTVTIVDDWNRTYATLATGVTLGVNEYRRFERQAVPRGYYIGMARCAEDLYGVPFWTRTPEFFDVPARLAFHSEIMWLASEGISTGWPDGTFRPGEPINRDAMAAFLYRLAGEPTVSLPAASPFSDVAPDAPFYKEVCWLASTAISTGFPDGTFGPKVSVSREAVAAFLFRFFYDQQFPGRFAPHRTPTVAPFVDVPLASPFAREIAWLKQYEITTGYGDGTFRPHDVVARDAMAAFLFREHLVIVSNADTAEPDAPAGPAGPARVALDLAERPARAGRD